MKTYKIRPILKSFVWGSDILINRYNLDSSFKNIGTIYFVIAIENELDNIVEEEGITLSEFYKKNNDLFGYDDPFFPVRMTITANNSYQSYQLHPDDAYAIPNEHKKGKVSGSVSLFPTENSKVRKMYFGNKCKTLDEFKRYVKNEEWDKLFDVIDKPAGAYLHTPAGVIHGGKGGGEIAATFGTNGDITYRFFDYHRNDSSRPLHLEQIYETVNIPEIHLDGPVIIKPINMGDLQIYNYYDKANEYVAKRIKVNGRGKYRYDDFMFYSCVQGSGTIAGRKIEELETIFVPKNYGEITLEGNMDLIMISYHK